MADNTTLPGTGDVIATDDVSGVKYERVKITDGTADSTTPLAINAANTGRSTSTVVVPVQVVGADGAVLPAVPVVTNAMLGAATSDAAVVTDATGTIHQYLRGLVKLIVAKIGVTVAAGDNATEGNTTDAAASTTVAEDATARTIDSLLKGIKNTLLAQRSIFGIDVTPTLTVHATYVANDFVGTSATAIEFANAARVSGGGGVVVGAVLDDYAKQDVAMELWLFDTAPTPPNDSAAWTITDAHSARLVGVIPFSAFYDSALNSVSNGVIPNGGIPYICAATSLFGCLVTRGAPAYASGDLTVRLYVTRD